jgi:carbonic anhydrase
MNRLLRLLAPALVLASSACADRGADPVRSPTPAPAPAASECKDAPLPHWSYKNPEAWGSLPGYAVCGDGDRQSPIDVLANPHADAPASDAPELRFEGARVKGWVNNGHTLETEIAPGSTLRVGGVTYTLVNVHFHVPAEHLVGKTQHAMEMHLVTKDDPVNTKSAKVFGVFFDEHEGAPGALGAILDAFGPSQPDKVCSREAPEGTALDLGPLIPKKTALWAYEGSLTVPACSQIVTFYLAQQPVLVSPAEVRSFVDRVGSKSTARPVQPRNHNVVRDIKAP